MKYIETNLSEYDWDAQGVYADDNGRLVGFDLHQQCCEIADIGWWSAAKDFDLKSARFSDPFEEINPPDACLRALGWNTEDTYYGAKVAGFAMIDEAGNTGYVVVGNYHNGYYAHSYTVKDGDKVIEEGSL